MKVDLKKFIDELGKKPIAISHSRLSTYQQCPRKFQLQFIKKAFPDDSNNPHFVRGNSLHEQMEAASNALVKRRSKPDTPLPPLVEECRNAVPIVEKIVNTYDTVAAEQQVAIDASLKRTGWFDKTAMFRAIFDLVAVNTDEALLVDWKTGKVRPYDGWGGQLHMAGWIGMCIFPDIDKVTSFYAYLDHRKSAPIALTRDKDFDRLTDHYVSEFMRINRDEEFEPRLNKYCKWCSATVAQCPNSTQKI